MSSAISRIHAPSRPTAGSSSTSAGDQIRARGGEVQRDRTAEGMPDHHDRAGGLGRRATSASAATLASIVHGASHDDRP